MSLPSWERGLKSQKLHTCRWNHKSLPSWERGLKWNRCRNGWRMVLSLPSWERGLKLHLFTFILSNLYVAPLVGAWIEIVGRKTEKIFRKSSLPSWERGLK